MTVTCVCCVAGTDVGEADALRCVHDRLLRNIEKREDYLTSSSSPTASVPSPSLWISTWVDYTTKYGLGYLLNNGCVGVYFNDSTKIILASDGERFEYYERSGSSGGGGAGAGGMPVEAGAPVASHTLSCYPPDLNKKVTLLKHFRAYLVSMLSLA